MSSWRKTAKKAFLRLKKQTFCGLDLDGVDHLGAEIEKLLCPPLFSAYTDNQRANQRAGQVKLKQEKLQFPSYLKNPLSASSLRHRLFPTEVKGALPGLAITCARRWRSFGPVGSCSEAPPLPGFSRNPALLLVVSCRYFPATSGALEAVLSGAGETFLLRFGVPVGRGGLVARDKETGYRNRGSVLTSPFFPSRFQRPGRACGLSHGGYGPERPPRGGSSGK